MTDLAQIAERLGQIEQRLGGIESQLDPSPDNDRYILKPFVPMLELYNGVKFGQRVLMGVAGIITTLATVGGIILWFLEHVTFKR